jgi:hypothetical protein
MKEERLKNEEPVSSKIALISYRFTFRFRPFLYRVAKKTNSRRAGRGRSPEINHEALKQETPVALGLTSPPRNALIAGNRVSFH